MEINSNPPNPSRLGYIKRFFRWLFLIAGAVALFIAGYFLALRFAFGHEFGMPSPGEKICFALVNLLALVFLAVLLIPCFRWSFRHMKWVSCLWASLFTWRMARRTLACMAIFATLLAVFYAEENWRGKRAWEKCKRELEAKGEVLDWSAYIPAPIPDEQDIMKAPNMAKWFYKNSPEATTTNSLSTKFNYSKLSAEAKTNNPQNPVLITRVSIGPQAGKTKNGEEIVIQLTATEASDRLKEVVRDAIGPSANGSQGSITFVQRPVGQIKTRHVFVQTETQLSAAKLSETIPASLVSSNVGRLRVEADSGPNSFRVVLVTKPTIAAEDYLAATDPGMVHLNLVRDALKRPQIRMEGNYQRPYEVPTVNFVAIRTVAQIMAQRAQCCLLLGKSEQAFHELSFVYDLRRLLTAKPTTLVSAMIDVAITGLYASVIADGIRLQAWREPELLALQKQIHQIKLPFTLVESFRDERAALCHTLETTPGGEMSRLFSLGSYRERFWRRMTDPTFLLWKFSPRGWTYQTAVLLANVGQTAIEGFVPVTQTIRRHPLETANREIERMAAHWSPYATLAAIVLPNFTRATQTAARNQTLVNQALIVCGLERYHRARGEYPETLDALVPQFVEKLAHDIIGDQPLRYRRTADGKFILYSVGWNEIDDGGQLGLTNNGSSDFTKGDWVW